MKRIHIFKAGTHTAMSGVELAFSEEDLKAMVDAYNGGDHEAPITVGHPKDNDPAFGWISGLEFADGNVYAIPHQVNEDFSELVEAGAYKKVSASLYTPAHPANPTPGKYQVRHVGFLGAMPPAIKGLEAVQFSEDDGEVLEFSLEWEVAGVFRRLREFFIEKWGLEDADKAIPAYLVESAEDVARTPPDNGEAAIPAYSESEGEESTMTPEELEAARKQLEKDQAEHQANVASFNETQETAAAQAEEARKAALRLRIDDLVKNRKIVPATAEVITAFAEALDATAVLEFGEGDDKTKKSLVDTFLDLVKNGLGTPNFGEAAAAEEQGAPNAIVTANDLAKRAVEFRESEAQAGREISPTQAVQHCLNNQ